MISETEIIDQWTVISDCITKPDESPQAIEILTTEMFTESGCRDVFKVFATLQADGLPTDINHVKDEIQRIYRLLKESQGDRDLRQAAHWIEQHGGTVRARDLVSCRCDITDAEPADDLLHRLVNAGFGSWKRVHSGERGGRPTMEFSLYPVHAD